MTDQTELDIIHPIKTSNPKGENLMTNSTTTIKANVNENKLIKEMLECSYLVPCVFSNTIKNEELTKDNCDVVGYVKYMPNASTDYKYVNIANGDAYKYANLLEPVTANGELSESNTQGSLNSNILIADCLRFCKIVPCLFSNEIYNNKITLGNCDCMGFVVEMPSAETEFKYVNLVDGKKYEYAAIS